MLLLSAIDSIFIHLQRTAFGSRFGMVDDIKRLSGIMLSNLDTLALRES
jgi:hypothetical protein